MKSPFVLAAKLCRSDGNDFTDVEQMCEADKVPRITDILLTKGNQACFHTNNVRENCTNDDVEKLNRDIYAGYDTIFTGIMTKVS